MSYSGEWWVYGGLLRAPPSPTPPLPPPLIFVYRKYNALWGQKRILTRILKF